MFKKFLPKQNNFFDLLIELTGAVNEAAKMLDEMMDKEEENVAPFVKGESVKVIDGPFNGFNGTIDDILEDKKKLKVMVKIFGRKTILELNFVQVVKE